MKENFNERIRKAGELLAEADFVLIGAGAGLSTAGGFEYSGEKFEKYFEDFGKIYGFRDMYSGGFYPYKTSEEKWAFWSRYVFVNRYLESSPNKVYSALFDLVKNKDYFVITTNVDHQFQLVNFDKERLFYLQGDYGLFQCSVPCHNKTYDNRELILQMLKSQNFITIKKGKIEITDKTEWKTKIDSALIPKCPVCSREMEMNLRSDDRFVQDDGWYVHAQNYQNFVDKTRNKKLVLLEIGIGYNTPAIIKYPFEQMTYTNKNTHLIRINKDYAICPDDIARKTILFDEDILKILENLQQL